MKKIDDVFGDTLFEDQKEDLASLIYYPSEKLDYVKSQGKADDSWYRTTLYRLVSVCQIVSSKYTRSKVRKAMPDNFRYVIEELITEKKEVLNKRPTMTKSSIQLLKLVVLMNLSLKCLT